MLLPSAVTVGLLNVLLIVGTRHLYSHSHSHSKDAILPGLFVIAGYTVFVLLRAGDVARRPNPHPLDAAVRRHAPLLLTMVTVSMVIFLVILECLEMSERTFFTLLPAFELALGCLTELGLILSVVLVTTPSGLSARNTGPLKALGIPFLMLYTLLMMTWCILMVLQVVNM